MGTWKSSETPENSELDYRGQNTSPWGVFYTVGKVLNRKCRKWPRISHLDIRNTSYVRKKGRESNCNTSYVRKKGQESNCSTSYVRKKGWESNQQFDSQPLKAGNRPDVGVCRWSVTHRWKALKESYKFASDLIPIGGLNKELWAAKVPRVQTGTISG
jgi:hypothetical protein